MGEVFAGRYELVDIIGEGGMGSVWQVHDRKHDQLLAAKVLRQSDAGSLLRFMREQGVRIHHPNVVTPLGWAGEDDRVLFTMPLVDGGSVSDLMRDGHRTLPPLYVAELVRQLLAALDAVHRAGVVHRDVKPANLLLAATGTDRPQLRLTDFGIAVPVDSPRMTTQAVVLGTPGYLAPEQLRGGEPAPSWDLYATGIVALQLLSGEKAGDNRQHRDDLPIRPPHVPDQLWRVVVDLADPDPAGRPPSAGAAAAALAGPDVAWVPQTAISVPRRVDADPERTRAQSFDATGTAPFGQTASPAQAPASPTAVQGNQQPAQGAGRTNVPAPGAAPAPEGAPARATPGRRAKLAGLVAAPLVALAALAFVWWPQGSDAGNLPPGAAKIGGTCQWQDAGTTEADSAGKTLLVCTAQGSEYTWQRVK
ncbi:serine/threonine protein kinase [Flexivirga sp. ID2601S]|uniref:non-specific serine/threonine protein kinase n=1 Tax=Flexivirga aerilata TaxID=1656889 RepID=A0A849ALF9_9MICO|nr:serine/threonine protein kinase [Flexivirga aerilata]